MADDDRPKSHPEAADADRLPVPGADRQRAYRRSRATRSLDVSGQTHELLRALCDRDGLGIDAAVRSAVGAALAQGLAERDVLEAAWTYLEATERSFAEFDEQGYLTERQVQSVRAAVTAYEEAARAAGDLSPKARWRARWLGEQGAGYVAYVDSNSVPAEPLAADVRHGSVGDTAQTLVAGGSGIGLHNASAVLQLVDLDAGEPIARVRAPGLTR